MAAEPGLPRAPLGMASWFPEKLWPLSSPVWAEHLCFSELLLSKHGEAIALVELLVTDTRVGSSVLRTWRG